MNAWLRTPFGLVQMTDTDPRMGGAYPTLVKDVATNGTAVATESTYETDKTSLTGADANLKMAFVADKAPPSASNPGL